MPKPRRTPKYCLHKPTAQAYCRINGKMIYLGPYDSPESHSRYREIVDEWMLAKSADRHTITVDELCLRYFEHSKTHYRKNGKPTSEQDCIRSALRLLIKLFGRVRAADFGPLKLGEYRDRLIREDYAIATIRKHVGRVKTMFKWAASLELVPVAIHTALTTLPHIEAGRSEARVTEPVQPVPRAHIRCLRHEVSPTVRGLINFQLLTGCRPGEAIAMTLRNVDMTGDVWRYEPDSHKTIHHGKRRVIFIGPRAQAIVRCFMAASLDAPVFRHGDSGYTIHGYRWAVRRACQRLKIDVWSPNQLRHNAATSLRRRFGIEHVRTILGHSSAVTSEIYAEVDAGTASSIMGRVG